MAKKNAQTSNRRQNIYTNTIELCFVLGIYCWAEINMPSQTPLEKTNFFLKADVNWKCIIMFFLPPYSFL